MLAYREGRRIPTTQSYYNFINVVDTHDVRITSQGTTFYELEARPDVDIRGWRSTGVTEYEHALSAWELRQGDQTVKFRSRRQGFHARHSASLCSMSSATSWLPI